LALIDEAMRDSIEPAWAGIIDRISPPSSVDEEAAVIMCTGAVLASRGLLREAYEEYAKALRMLEGTEFHALELRLMNTMGSAEVNLGEVEQGLARSDDVISYANAHRDAIERDAPGWADRIANSALVNKGIGHFYTGGYPQAMQYWLEALSVAERIDADTQVNGCLMNLGNVYAAIGEYVTSMRYYHRALAMPAHVLSVGTLAELHGNIGYLHFCLKEYNDALREMQRSIELVEERGRPGDALNGRVNMAQVYLTISDTAAARSALAPIDGSLDLRPEQQSELLMCRGLIAMQEGDVALARERLEEARVTAVDSNSRGSLLLILGHLRDLALHMQDLQGYVEFNQQLISLQDEISGREAAINIKMQEKEREIAEERRIAELQRNALYSALPKHVADRVVRGEDVTDHFDVASVLFMDIVGFTTISDRIPPGHVVHLLKAIFKICDDVCARHGLTKVKTIGDSYLAVSGVPEPLDDHAQRAARAAVDMIRELNELTLSMDPSLGDTSWTQDIGEITVRIGLHCGPVVAGIVGEDRLQYDVWGDTVNTASRMESTGEPGKVQCSESFERSFASAQDDVTARHPEERSDEGPLFSFTRRGSIDIKGKGTMTTYWLEGAPPT